MNALISGPFCHFCVFSSQATLVACTELKQRIDAATTSLPADATWLKRVQMCAGKGVDLTARGW